MSDNVARSHAFTGTSSDVAQIAGMVPRRPIVPVLGMHRSGTSLCAYILSMLGVDMADTAFPPGMTTPGADNLRGHWERWEIVEFHDRILKFFNREYATPFHGLPLPIAWWADPRVAEVKREIIEFLERRMGKGLFGFKDPRTVRLMPIWHHIVKELRLVPKIVFCLRNPARVARSLAARDQLDTDVAEYLWFSYVVDFFRYTHNCDTCIVEYERWFDDPSTNLNKLLRFLDIRWELSEFELDLAISNIVDRTLRHDDPMGLEANQPLVRTLYKLASHADQDAATREQIHSIVSQFVVFQQLQGPLQRRFENAGALAAALSGVEREAAGLRAALSEREEMVAAANGRAASAEERLAAALQSTQSELALRDEAVQRAEQDARERSASLAALQADAAGLRAALSEREEMVAAANGRAASAEERLAAALQSAQSELALRDEAVRQAEQDARERGAALEALQAETASLRSSLDAAREVEKAASAALRNDVLAQPLRNADGWHD